jgi:hypothetical protein
MEQRTELALDPLTGTTDELGFFRFEDLDSSQPIVYQAQVEVDGVAFVSGFASPAVEQTEATLPINVYDTTSQPDGVMVDRLHFIAMVEEPGVLSMVELYQFSNQGNLAFAGESDAEGRRVTVRMALPEGAQDLTLEGGTLGQDFWQEDGQIVSGLPVLPGGTTLDVAFSYLVLFDGASLSLDRPLYYDVREVNGLVADLGEEMESQQLTFVDEVTAHDQSFKRYIAKDLKAGQTLELYLDDLDKIWLAEETTMPAGHPGSPVAAKGLQQRSIFWMMLGVGLVAVLLALFYPSLRPGPGGPVSAGTVSPEQERQRLLSALASLDQAYANGELDETSYRNARHRYKSRLADLWSAGQD